MNLRHSPRCNRSMRERRKSRLASSSRQNAKCRRGRKSAGLQHRVERRFPSYRRDPIPRHKVRLLVYCKAWNLLFNRGVVVKQNACSVAFSNDSCFVFPQIRPDTKFAHAVKLHRPLPAVAPGNLFEAIVACNLVRRNFRRLACRVVG